MLDSHLGVPDAVPEADAWRTGSPGIDGSGAAAVRLRPGRLRVEYECEFSGGHGLRQRRGADPAPRHAVRQHGRGQGHRQRRTDLPAAPRRTLLRHLPLPPPQWRRAVDRGHLPAADQSGRRGRAHLGRLAQVHRRRRAAGRGAPAAAGHQRDRQRRGRVRPGRPHRLRQRGLSPHARLRPPPTVNQELGELLAGGRPDGGTREELDRRIACREATTRTCWSTIAPASRYGCLSPTPCSTSAARWSTWWMC